jgi:poly-beta-1,6-N-acetyl-D-glucosamine biosynthesis protein PgaD
MNTLIIDRFARQPLSKRLLCICLTALGWAFWSYLWLPLLGSVEIFFGASSEHILSTSQSFRELFGTLGSHASTIVVAIGLFLVWSLLQWFGNRRSRSATSNQAVTSRRLAQSVKLHEDDLTAWQQSRRMVVTHDEDSGWIRDVSVLEASAVAG